VYRLSNRGFPLDLEELANFDLGIEINIAKGLLEECGSPAQIALSGSTPVITVDSDQYQANTGFYRFSLAHEIAHWVLHRKWLKEVYNLIGTVEDWKAVFRSISQEDYFWIESQADEFAAYLVAPPESLDPFLKSEIALIGTHLKDLAAEVVLPYLANPVSQKFGTTTAAAQARIRKSPVWRNAFPQSP
jgi:hypothetical protein